MNRNIAIEELPCNIDALGLTRGDYIVTFPADFYNGAGVYSLETGGSLYFAKCIEMLDGKIKVCEVGTMNSRVMTIADFKKSVQRKIFARVTLDCNIPGIAATELRELLTRA